MVEWSQANKCVKVSNPFIVYKNHENISIYLLF